MVNSGIVSCIHGKYQLFSLQEGCLTLNAYRSHEFLLPSPLSAQEQTETRRQKRLCGLMDQNHPVQLQIHPSFPHNYLK